MTSNNQNSNELLAKSIAVKSNSTKPSGPQIRFNLSGRKQKVTSRNTPKKNSSGVSSMIHSAHSFTELRKSEKMSLVERSHLEVKNSIPTE